jgi:hypothetical protein
MTNEPHDSEKSSDGCKDAKMIERREAFFALQGYITHRDGCKCATEAHCASDCTCGMYSAMTRLQEVLARA